MGKSATYSGDLLKLALNGTPIANIADNAGTSPLTNLYVALHTADPSTTAGPGTLGTATASEVAYTGYARAAVARSSSSPAWTVTGTSASPVANINFPASTGGGSQTATFWSVSVASTGASKILYSGPITPSSAIASGAQAPQLTTVSTITEN